MRKFVLFVLLTLPLSGFASDKANMCGVLGKSFYNGAQFSASLTEYEFFIVGFMTELKRQISIDPATEVALNSVAKEVWEIHLSLSEDQVYQLYYSRCLSGGFQ